MVIPLEVIRLRYAYLFAGIQDSVEDEAPLCHTVNTVLTIMLWYLVIIHTTRVHPL